MNSAENSQLLRKIEELLIRLLVHLSLTQLLRLRLLYLYCRRCSCCRCGCCCCCCHLYRRVAPRRRRRVVIIERRVVDMPAVICPRQRSKSRLLRGHSHLVAIAAALPVSTPIEFVETSRLTGCLAGGTKERKESGWAAAAAAAASTTTGTTVQEGRASSPARVTNYSADEDTMRREVKEKVFLDHEGRTTRQTRHAMIRTHSSKN